jgi:hypothetical protein
MMREKNELFDRKHLRLWRISAQADFLSNIVLVVYILIAIAQAYEYITNNNLYISNLTNDIFQGPAFILKAFLYTAVLLLQGGVYYVALKGIALGLTIIVETDINYRDSENQEGIE